MAGLEKRWQEKTILVGRSLVVHHVIYFGWKEKGPKVRIQMGIMGHDERPGQLIRGINGKRFLTLGTRRCQIQVCRWTYGIRKEA